MPRNSVVSAGTNASSTPPAHRSSASRGSLSQGAASSPNLAGKGPTASPNRRSNSAASGRVSKVLPARPSANEAVADQASALRRGSDLDSERVSDEILKADQGASDDSVIDGAQKDKQTANSFMSDDEDGGTGGPDSGHSGNAGDAPVLKMASTSSVLNTDASLPDTLPQSGSSGAMKVLETVPSGKELGDSEEVRRLRAENAELISLEDDIGDLLSQMEDLANWEDELRSDFGKIMEAEKQEHEDVTALLRSALKDIAQEQDRQAKAHVENRNRLEARHECRAAWWKFEAAQLRAEVEELQTISTQGPEAWASRLPNVTEELAELKTAAQEFSLARHKNLAGEHSQISWMPIRALSAPQLPAPGEGSPSRRRQSSSFSPRLSSGSQDDSSSEASSPSPKNRTRRCVSFSEIPVTMEYQPGATSDARKSPSDLSVKRPQSALKSSNSERRRTDSADSNVSFGGCESVSSAKPLIRVSPVADDSKTAPSYPRSSLLLPTPGRLSSPRKHREAAGSDTGVLAGRETQPGSTLVSPRALVSPRMVSPRTAALSPRTESTSEWHAARSAPALVSPRFYNGGVEGRSPLHSPSPNQRGRSPLCMELGQRLMPVGSLKRS